MMKKIGIIIPFLLICVCLMNPLMAQEPQQPNQPENGHGAVSIGIGTNADPVTLPGDSPNIPPKPQKSFYTNSIVLNQILGNYDDCANFMQTLAQFKTKGIVDYGEIATAPALSDSFIVVIDATEKIVAVLDKGGEKRINLLNSQFETMSQYAESTYKKLWFTISE